MSALAAVDQRVLTERGQRMLDSLPYYLHADPTVRAYVDAIARELDRVEGMLAAVRRGLIPATADDEFGLLGMWETLFGLPVQPPDATIPARRAIVLATLQSRQVASAEEWARAMDSAIGPGWEHSEDQPAPYVLRLRVPFVLDSYNIGRTRALAREITPAHLDIRLTSSAGFVVGRSRVGDPI